MGPIWGLYKRTFRWQLWNVLGCCKSTVGVSKPSCSKRKLCLMFLHSVEISSILEDNFRKLKSRHVKRCQFNWYINSCLHLAPKDVRISVLEHYLYLLDSIYLHSFTADSQLKSCKTIISASRLITMPQDLTSSPLKPGPPWIPSSPLLPIGPGSPGEPLDPLSPSYPCGPFFPRCPVDPGSPGGPGMPGGPSTPLEP